MKSEKCEFGKKYPPAIYSKHWNLFQFGRRNNWLNSKELIYFGSGMASDLIEKIAIKNFFLHGLHGIELTRAISHSGNFLQDDSMVKGIFYLFAPAKWPVSINQNPWNPHRIQFF